MVKVQSIEFIHLDVPFTAHTNEHMQYWLPHHRIFQLCKITLENGVTGWGEITTTTKIANRALCAILRAEGFDIP